MHFIVNRKASGGTGNSAVVSTVELMNTTGMVLMTSVFEGDKSLIEMNTSALAEGIYLVRIQSDITSVIKRIVISH